jgi:hypothetical protein
MKKGAWSMKPKTARRFLGRNAWKIAAWRIGKDEPNHFFRKRFNKATITLNETAYKALSPYERIAKMFMGSGAM